MASKTEDIKIALAELKKDSEYLRERIDKINGSLNSYPVYINKVDELEKSMDKVTLCLEDIKKLISGIKIKIWSVAGLIGGIMGFVGVIIGKFIS